MQLVKHVPTKLQPSTEQHSKVRVWGGVLMVKGKEIKIQGLWWIIMADKG
jgi:hypothetical protein